MRTIKSLILLALIFSVAVSCKKSNDDSGDQFPEFLRAVWQDEEFDDGDEIGIYFTSTKLGSWDYYGDSYDEGEDCYSVFEVGEIVSYSGNEYRIKIDEDFSNEEEEMTVIIEVDGNTMTITDPEDGEETIPYSKDSRKVADMTPECSDSFKASQAQKHASKILTTLGIK